MAFAWGCKSIAFPCISAGCYKFPLGLATEVAVRTVGRWMKANGSTLKVVFVTYTKEANEVYHDTLKWWAEWDRNRRNKDCKGKTVKNQRNGFRIDRCPRQADADSGEVP